MAVEEYLCKQNIPAYCLDGDNIRFGLNKDLGFSPEDREENIRRIGEVAKLFADAGVVCLVSFISPYRKDRDRARQVHEDSGLTFCETPVDTVNQTVDQSVAEVVKYLKSVNIVDKSAGVNCEDLFVPEDKLEAAKAEAEGLEKYELSKVDTQWLQVLSEGWAYPLKGFMKEDDFLT